MSDHEIKEQANEAFGKLGELTEASQDVDYALAKRSTLDIITKDVDQPVEWASFLVDTRAKEMKLNAMRAYIGNDIRRLKQEDGFLVSDLYLTSQCYTAKDGEVIQGPVLHLISPEGKSIRIVAKYTILSILTFAKSWHKFPWTPPVRMRCKDLVLDNNNRVYEMEYLE